jgi:hypothetical protein
MFTESLFFSEKYKRVQLFKVHFLQNSSLLQFYTSASDNKVVEFIPRSQFLEASSAFVIFLIMSIASHQC